MGAKILTKVKGIGLINSFMIVLVQELCCNLYRVGGIYCKCFTLKIKFNPLYLIRLYIWVKFSMQLINLKI